MCKGLHLAASAVCETCLCKALGALAALTVALCTLVLLVLPAGCLLMPPSESNRLVRGGTH